MSDETFDDFINWNKYAFICFHGDSEALIGMITEYLSQVNLRMQSNEPAVKFGMINVENARIVEARF